MAKAGDRPYRKWLALLLPALLFLWGLALCMFYGRAGFHPLDHSIVFDGAWRLQSGQDFFEDFTTPNGFTPILIQRIFFSIFGLNWFSYCLHAGVFNGLACILVYFFMRKAGSGKALSVFYGAFTGLVFYTPMGVPYMDQHSFFFLLWAAYLCFPAVNETPRKEMLRLSLVWPVFVLALFSKQTPAVFGFPLLLVLLLRQVNPQTYKRMLKAFAAGALISLAFVLLFFPFAVFRFEDFKYFTIDLPSGIGSLRMESIHDPFFKAVRTIAYLPLQLFSPSNNILLLLFYLPWVTWLLSFAGQKFFKKETWYEHGHLWFLLAAAILILISGAFMRLTQNQLENGIGLVPLCLGLMHVFWLKFVSENPLLSRAGDRVRRAVVILFSAALVTKLSFDFHWIHRKYIVPHSVNDLWEHPPDPCQWPRSFSGLDFMIHVAPAPYNLNQPDTLLAFLEKEPGNIFVFGDYSILYGLSGRPSLSPSLWLHRGLTIPDSGTVKWQDWQQKLLNRLDSFKPRFVIFDNPLKETYMHLRPASFPRFENWLSAHKADTLNVGNFILWEMKYPAQEEP